MTTPNSGGYDGRDNASGFPLPANDGGLPYGQWGRPQPANPAAGASAASRPPQRRNQPASSRRDEVVVEGEAVEITGEPQLEGAVPATEFSYRDAPPGKPFLWLRFHFEPRRSDGHPIITLVVDWFARPPQSVVRSIQHDLLERISIERLRQFVKQFSGTARRLATNAVAEYERLAAVEYQVVLVSPATDDHARREIREFYNAGRSDVGSKALELLRVQTGSLAVSDLELRIERWEGGRRVERESERIGQYDIFLLDAGGNQIDQWGELSDQPTFSIFARSNQQALAVVAEALGQRAFLYYVEAMRVARYVNGAYQQAVEADFWSFFSDDEWEAFYQRLEATRQLPAGGTGVADVARGLRRGVAWLAGASFECAAGFFLVLWDGTLGRVFSRHEDQVAVDGLMDQQAGLLEDETEDEPGVSDLDIRLNWRRAVVS